MDSARETLFAQVKTYLQAIDGASPYTNRLRVVSRDDIALDGLGMYPSAVMVEQSEPEERTSSSQRVFRLARLLLIVAVETNPATDASSQLNSLRADVFYRMMLDPVQNGTCYRTIYVDYDPRAVADSGFAGFAMTFDFHYGFTWSTP